MGSQNSATLEPRVLGIDAGGTMTDTFVVEQSGKFVVGKAQTTPHDESIGFMASARDALDQWGIAAEDGFRTIASGIYSGTAMLNRLLERKGRRVGLIVTAGCEDTLRIERGVQTYLGYSYADRLHVATHYHNVPLVPRDLIKGVRGRIDSFGTEAIPLYEDEARQAVAELLDAGVDSIVVCFLQSYRAPVHEQRVRDIAAEVAPDLPVFCSSEFYPVKRDFPRLNTTLIEAYAAEPSREQLGKIRDASDRAGAGFEIRIMAAHGGTISIEAQQLARTLISGPIGGVVGSKYLAEVLGGNGGVAAGGDELSNVLCTDIGGTSFDIALITNREFAVRQIPDVGRYLLNIPMVQIDSIGAGTGSFVRLDPNSNRPEFGPDSAGASIGVSWVDSQLETPSITDLNLVLGRVNPEYFLGGQVVLDPERARQAIATQLAEPLGLTVEQCCAGIIELFDDTLKYEATGRILGKGYAPVDYALLCYGGGGPLHVAGYTRGVAYKDVLVPTWAGGFSAFGCACADFAYRYDRTVDVAILPGASASRRAEAGGAVTSAWRTLRESVAAEFAKVGIDAGRVEFRHHVRMQYLGQLTDLEVPAGTDDLGSAAAVDEVIASFEEAYGKVYARSARSPELGYLITTAIVVGSVPVEKPALPVEPERSGTPTEKEVRRVWWDDGWQETPIYEQEAVAAGQVVSGPAIVESPADTFAIPPGRHARLDTHRIWHLRHDDEEEWRDGA